MVCKKCGAALPATSMVCIACSNPMAPDQIEGMRSMNRAHSMGARQVEIRPIQDIEDDTPPSLGDYKPPKENKYIGVIVIFVVIAILIVIAAVMHLS